MNFRIFSFCLAVTLPCLALGEDLSFCDTVNFKDALDKCEDGKRHEILGNCTSYYKCDGRPDGSFLHEGQTDCVQGQFYNRNSSECVQGTPEQIENCDQKKCETYLHSKGKGEFKQDPGFQGPTSQGTTGQRSEYQNQPTGQNTYGGNNQRPGGSSNQNAYGAGRDQQPGGSSNQNTYGAGRDQQPGGSSNQNTYGAGRDQQPGGASNDYEDNAGGKNQHGTHADKDKPTTSPKAHEGTHGSNKNGSSSLKALLSFLMGTFFISAFYV